jgi:hypothetical protein
MWKPGTSRPRSYQDSDRAILIQRCAHPFWAQEMMTDGLGSALLRNNYAQGCLVGLALDDR